MPPYQVTFENKCYFCVFVKLVLCESCLRILIEWHDNRHKKSKHYDYAIMNTTKTKAKFYFILGNKILKWRLKKVMMRLPNFGMRNMSKLISNWLLVMLTSNWMPNEIDSFAVFLYCKLFITRFLVSIQQWNSKKVYVYEGIYRLLSP